MDDKNAAKYMLISTLAFACMNAIVKHLTTFSAFQIVFFRSIITLCFTVSYLKSHKISIIGTHHTLLITRSIVGVTSMSLFFMSIKYLAVGTAVSLRYTAPIFAALFAVLFLKEKIRPIQWLFFFTAFSGVIILKGFDKELNSYGLTLVILAAITSGLVFTLISKIGKREHPVVIVNYFMFIATLVGGVGTIFTWRTPKAYEWLLLFLLGVFGYFGQVYMTKAFQTSSTNQVAPLKYIEVIFTLCFGLLLYNETYSLWSLLGITLIIGGLVLNALYKIKSQKKAA